jgi:hypothetical protein
LWINQELSDWDDNVFFFAAFSGMLDFPTYDALLFENSYLKLLLLPNRGKPYSFIYKVTGNEELFIPETAQVLGSSNKTGWWFALGGVEYNMPDEEHGETWAAPWDWEISEDSPSVKSVKMSVNELRFGLKESVTISVFPDKAFYQADISITNPTDSTIKFQHWINPMWVPGGNSDGLTPNTEFIIPTDEVFVTDRPFNNWMLGYSPDSSRLQTYTGSSLRFLKYWKGYGDLLAWKLDEGYYSAFSHEHNEGIVRVFPLEINPGCNIWTWGINPSSRTRMRFSGNESHKGYVEMWGGITHGFDNYFSLAPGQSISWTEWMYPYSNTRGLHYANRDLAITFFRTGSNDYEVNLCPSGEINGIKLLARSKGSNKNYLRLAIKKTFPDQSMKTYCFNSEEEDVELIILKDGKELKRLDPQIL